MERVGFSLSLANAFPALVATPVRTIHTHTHTLLKRAAIAVEIGPIRQWWANEARLQVPTSAGSETKTSTNTRPTLALEESSLWALFDGEKEQKKTYPQEMLRWMGTTLIQLPLRPTGAHRFDGVK